MEKQTFNILINASPEKVWDILLGESTYPQWTSVFAEGSSVETDWKEGSRALFLDGKGQGMVSVIAKNIPNKYLSIKHLGMIKDGVEDMESEEVKKWSGALENYTLKPLNGSTELIIEMDMAEEFKDYFLTTWPKALDKVKELAEMQHHEVG
ncbi:SRPBCC domain-containing protein [Pedobacter sp. P351]|uniref:SRPBCC family protein n=1 Tax=Pedobacter superstes TaxID=3133441 RepID=UPI00309E181C